MHPQFPIYIPSKSRADSRLTMRTLDRLHIDYRVIVEEQQYRDYAAVMPASRLLVLDPAYQDSYDPFDELGQSKPLGPGPARNMAWEHAIAEGHRWHWVMDDNIDGFYWLNNNRKLLAVDAGPFVLMEEFVQRYTNIAMAGPQYTWFVKARQKLPPFITGTRIYSCNLIRNDMPMRWRGRYNEDTDLSLRMLKAGWNTVEFNAVNQQKKMTQTVRGGNTEAFYSVEGTLAKSQMIVAMHPDCARLLWRFGRPHHYVDYRKWLGRALIPDPDAPPPRQWRTRIVARDDNRALSTRE